MPGLGSQHFTPSPRQQSGRGGSSEEGPGGISELPAQLGKASFSLYLNGRSQKLPESGLKKSKGSGEPFSQGSGEWQELFRSRPLGSTCLFPSLVEERGVEARAKAVSALSASLRRVYLGVFPASLEDSTPGDRDLPRQRAERDTRKYVR